MTIPNLVAGSMSPIFIGGIRRSGTSLLRGIIGSHPDVAIYHQDLPLFSYYLDKFRACNLRDSCQASEFWAEIHRAIEFRDPNPPVCLKRIRSAFDQLPDQDKSVGSALECILRDYALAIGRPRFGLKTPYQEFSVDDIFAQFPGAKFVQIIRDPRDSSTSHAAYAHGAWINKIYTEDALIRDWASSSQRASINLDRFPESYLVLRYEDLASNPDATVARICEFLNLAPDPSMLRMDQQLGWNGHNSFYSDAASGGIFVSSIGKFRQLMGVYTQFKYQAMLRGHLARWDYALVHFSLVDRIRFTIIIWLEKGSAKAVSLWKKIVR